MQKKIHHRTIILSDRIFEQIQLLQKELSKRDGHMWDVSETASLLVQFCVNGIDMTCRQDYSFLLGYISEKEPFLKEFCLRVYMSIT